MSAGITKKDRPLFASALLLAGGQSRRMGFDKQTLEVDGQSLVEGILQALAPLFSDLVLVSQRPDLYQELLTAFPGLRLVQDLYPGRGPMAGIQAGLLASTSSYVYVTACDMPHTNPAFIRHMMEEIRLEGGRAGAMVRREEGFLEPLNAFYRKDLAAEMEAALQTGETGLQAFCRTRPFLWISEREARALDPESLMFKDYNRPADLPGKGSLFHEMPSISELTRTLPLIRHSREGAKEEEDRVIREVDCRLVLEGEELTGFYALPDRLEDLARGWMALQGLTGAGEGIRDIRIMADPRTPDSCQIRVRLTKEDGEAPKSDPPSPGLPPALTLDQVSSLMAELNRRAWLFKATGGTHNMILVSFNLTVLDHVEDISRHNCFYKLVGRAQKEGRGLDREILVTSCRLTASLMDLIVRAQIPLVLSQAAVTSRALDMARDQGIGVLAFAREGRFNRYL